MCGRFAIDDTVDELIRAYVADGGEVGELPDAIPNANVRPTDTIAVVLETTRGLPAPRRVLAPARWGLVPPWGTTLASRGPTFNARLETLGEKATWKAPLARRRCVVPATAYYEWHGERGAKTPFAIGDPERERIPLAGLAQWWRAADDEPWLLTATIVTRAAIGDLARIHDRMPLVLPEDLVGKWIDAERIGDQDFADAIADASANACGALEAAQVASVPRPRGADRRRPERPVRQPSSLRRAP